MDTLDDVIATVCLRIPATDVHVTRTGLLKKGEIVTGWSVSARVPRMSRRGKKLRGDGFEEFRASGETATQAADRVVQFYELCREGRV